MAVDVIAKINKAADLFEQATRLYDAVQPALENVKDGQSRDLAAARMRLADAMGRAHLAHTSLDAAISARLRGE